MNRRSFRVFISSPSDVRPERAIAERVVAKLAREFAHHLEIASVLWEREPLVATRHFQDVQNIPAPGATDICVVVLWSRLGYPLPEEQFRGAISGRPVTGTEWEFEDALKSFQQRSLPDLLLYQKTAEVVASLSDEAGFEELRQQKRLVNDFMERWFRSAKGPAFTAASHVFATATEFEERLEEHLRTLLLRRLDRELGQAGEVGTITWTEPPWPALASFKLEQSPIFFGRMRARNELRDLLALQVIAGTAFILVIGASGSGKSSLVKAGLVSDLMLPGMIGEVGLVRHGAMRPSEASGDTLLALAEAILSASALPELAELDYDAGSLAAQLRQNPRQVAFAVKQGLTRAAAERLTARGQSRLLLVVDQLEELFTVEPIDASERQIFIDALAVLAGCGLVWVVATLRADFFDRLEQLPALASLSAGGRYLLLPPQRMELAEIVRRPAKAAGLRFEIDRGTSEGLDEVIINAAARDPGALPLLSFALDRLWREPRAGMELSYASYAKLGELEGAIAQHAESVVAALPPAAQDALPSLLLSLVDVRGGQQQAVARPCQRDELAASPSADRVVTQLIEARLLIADETAQGVTVRLAHETLLSRWPRLNSLIDESREALAVITRLRVDQEEWELSGKLADLLLPAGKRLTEGADLLQRRPVELGAPLTAFIKVSHAVAEAALRRRQRGVLIAFATLSLLLLATATGAWFGFSGQRAAQKQYALAEQRRAQNLALALKSEADPKLVEAVALSVLHGEAMHRGSVATPELINRLMVAANSDLQRLVLAHKDIVSSAAFSPDGQRIVTGSYDGKARLWNAQTGALLGIVARHEKRIYSVGFSPDGRRIVTASSDKTVRVWDAALGTLILTLPQHDHYFYCAAFSPDGRTILTGSADRTAKIWSATTGALLTTFSGHAGIVNSATFSSDGQRIATGSDDHTARIWSSASGALLATLTGHTGQVTSATFSPSGRFVVTASFDGSARTWNAASGAATAVMPGANMVVFTATFSPDGLRILTASADKTARLWDAATGNLLSVINGHDELVYSAAFSPDGRRIVTASQDRTARVWMIAEGPLLTVLAGHTGAVSSATFSPDGQRVLTGSEDRTAKLWNPLTGAISQTLSGHQLMLDSANFSPDGLRIVTASNDRTASIWNTASGALLAELRGHTGILFKASYSPSGLRIVTASGDGTARVWDANSQAVVLTLRGHTDYVLSAAFNADGTRIITSSRDGTARIWNASTGAMLMTLAGHTGPVNDAVFSPDDRFIVTASDDRTVRIWDAATGSLATTLIGHEDSVASAKFGPDGRYIVTASADTTSRVWNAKTGTLLAIMPHRSNVESAAFSPDGGSIVTASDDKLARVWQARNYLDEDNIDFLRAIASRVVDNTLRTRYALAAPPPVRPSISNVECDRAPSSSLESISAWTKGALAGDGRCDQRLAAYYEAYVSNFGRAFFYHALATRLFSAQGRDEEARGESYRREALAWLLPRAEVSRMMVEVDAWKIGAGLPR